MRQIKVVFAIVAALIGAGFASGQEICTFFYVYGVKGIVGLTVCGFLLTYIIYKVFLLLLKNNLNNYKDFIYALIGKNGLLVNTIVNSFLLITFFIMLSGFGAFFSQEANISKYIGSGILAFLCFLTFITKSNGVIRMSSLLVPILILFIVIIGTINVGSLNINSTFNLLPEVNGFTWLLNSILYCSYNSILLIPVLITLKEFIYSKKDIIIISIISGLIILVLAVSIFFLLTRVDIDISKLEMPIIYVIRHFYKSFMYIYAFIILASIYTSAISIGISFLNNIVKNKTTYPLIVIIMCITGFAISGFGFSNLVSKLYPIFGYLGLLQIGFLAKSGRLMWRLRRRSKGTVLNDRF